MTVADNTSRNQYTATSGQTVFAYTFEIVDKGDIVVLKNGTTLSEGTDYTVSNVGNDSGGNVTLTVGATAGDILTLYRDMPYSRTQNYTNSGDFLASEVNSDFDNLWLAGEQTNRSFSQSIRKPITDSDSISMELPEAATRKNSFLTFDATGAPTVTSVGDPGAPSSIVRQQFTGDGTTTAFTLASAPGALGQSVQIFIDGVYQENDTYSISGTTLTFTEAPPVNASIETVRFEVNDIGETSANLVSYTPAGTGAVQTTVQTKLRESVSVKDFGAVGDGVTDDTAAIQAAIDYVDSNGYVYLPSGLYKTTSPLYMGRAVVLKGDGVASKIKKSGTTAGTGSNVSPSTGSVTDSYAVDAVLIITHTDNSYGYYVGLYDLAIEGDDAFTTDYAVYAPRISQSIFQNVFLYKCNTAWLTYDGWQISFDRVTADPEKLGSALAAELGVSPYGPSATCRGFHWASDGGGGPSGTSVSWTSCWARRCDIGYDINNLNYSTMRTSAADAINSVPYKFDTCNNMNLSGCGLEKAIMGPGMQFGGGKYTVIGQRGVTQTYGKSGSGAYAATNNASVTFIGSTIGDFNTVNSALNRDIRTGANVSEIDTIMPTNGNNFISFSSGSTLRRFTSDEISFENADLDLRPVKRVGTIGSQLFKLSKSVLSAGTDILEVSVDGAGSSDYLAGKAKLFYSDLSYPNGVGYIEIAFTVFRASSNYFQNITAGTGSLAGNGYTTQPSFSFSRSSNDWTMTMTPAHGDLNLLLMEVEWYTDSTGGGSVTAL